MPELFILPALPYLDTALAPIISANAIGFHYNKHHQGYVDTLNKLCHNAEFANLSLVEIIKKTEGQADKIKIFNNAAQIWNHSFFWQSLSPHSNGKPLGKIADLIDRDLGGYEKFKSDFISAAIEQFGSGWSWLVMDQGKLKILKTSNAATPASGSALPLLAIDVWEHAYYLDYQNRRIDYVTAVIEKLLNWHGVNEKLEAYS